MRTFDVQQDQIAFVHRFFLTYARRQFEEGGIDYIEFEAFRKQTEDQRLLRSFSDNLHRAPGRSFEFLGHFYRLAYLLELGGAEFPVIQLIPKQAPAEKRICFVGHRFKEEIRRPLLRNLRILFEPYNIEPRSPYSELSSTLLLDNIIEKIEEADFCVFDNLGTLGKPNVYIEVGLAYKAGVHSIFCEYKGPTSIGEFEVPEPGLIPVDLAGLLRVQYKSYQELFQELYFRLPAFLGRSRTNR